MHSYRRVTAVVIAAGLLATAGCWNPAPEKYPSITFFGVSPPVITVGQDTSGNAVQGQAVLTWQTRLADKVSIVTVDPASLQTNPYNPKILSTVATFSAGQTSGCTVDPKFPNSDCVKDGTYTVKPTQPTIYDIEATVGAGNCARDPVLNTLLHPTECKDLTGDPNASLGVVVVNTAPPATLTLSVGGKQTTTVAAGTDVVADYKVGNQASFDFGISATKNGKPTYTACGSQADATAGKVPCWVTMDAQGNLTTPTGKVTVPNVQADTTLTGEAQNQAKDHPIGDVAPGATPSTVKIMLKPAITGIQVGGNDALGTTPVTVSADTATLTWTNSAAATTGTLSMAPATAIPSATGSTCADVPTASWTAVSGFSFSSGTYDLTGLTADTCFMMTATDSGATSTDTKYFEILRQVNINSVSANSIAVMTSGNMVSTGLYKFSIGSLSTTTNPPQMSWTTSNAGSFTVAFMAKPTGTACDKADYTSATTKTGTTGNGNFTPNATVSAASCMKLMVTHPTDSTRTATVYFEIDP